MLSKKVVKDIQSLGLKKNRQESGLFVAEGPKVVEELLKAVPERVEAVYATTGWTSGTATEVEISDEELAKMSQLKTPNKVLAVVRQFEQTIPVAEGLVLYLDTVQDPGNFGTILRIADWFGVKQVVCSPGCADLYNPKVVQATMASIARVGVHYDEDETWLAQSQLAVYAAALHGSPLSSFGKIDNGILVIGNESKGIRKEILSLATETVTIPRRGTAESLNAAVATGIILSHLT